MSNMFTPGIQALTLQTISEAIETMNDGTGQEREEAWKFVFSITQLSLSVVDDRIAQFLGIPLPNLQHTIPGNYLQGFYHSVIFDNGLKAFQVPYDRPVIVRRVLADYLWRSVPESEHAFPLLDHMPFTEITATAADIR
jgi:hypothetical protein